MNIETISYIAGIVGAVAAIGSLYYANRQHNGGKSKIGPNANRNGVASQVGGQELAGPSKKTDTQKDAIALQVPDNYAPISAEKVLNTVKDKNLTQIQISQFMSLYKDRVVHWKATVLDIRAASSKSFPAILVFKLPSDTSMSPEILTASFMSNHERDLVQLSKGQVVTIEGTLSFISTGTGPVPSLNNSRLILVE